MTKEQIKKIEENSIAYRNHMFSACYKRLDNSTDRADDCVQETYLALEHALKVRHTDIQDWKKWINRVLGRKMDRINGFRALFRANNYSLEQAEDEYDFFVPDVNINIAVCVENEEVKKKLYHDIMLLKKAEFEIIIRYYFCNQKLKDIAKESGDSEASLKKRHQRAKKKLKKMLQSATLGLSKAGVQ